MPTYIRRPDKNGTSTQRPHISPFSQETIPYSQASYTALEKHVGIVTIDMNNLVQIRREKGQ